MVYLTGTGARVWDSHHPDEAPSELPGEFSGDTAGAALLDPRLGLIWLIQVDDPFAAVQDTTINLVRLDGGRSATQLFQDPDVTVTAPFRGGLQLRVADGPLRLLQPDGTLADLPAGLQNAFVVDTYSGADGEVALVSEGPPWADPPAPRALLAHNTLPLVPVAGQEVEGEWVLATETADGRDSYSMYNYFTGVDVTLPEIVEHYFLRDDHLWVSAAGASYPVALAALPEVGCDAG